MRKIAALTIYNGELWYSPKYKKSAYLGDPINNCKLLSDMCVEEIVIYVLGDKNEEVLKKLPLVAIVPISICGGITELSQAEQYITSGYDRVGYSFSFRKTKNQDLLSATLDKFGGSSVFLHYSYFNSEVGIAADWVNQFDCNVSEIILSNIDQTGQSTGLDQRILPMIKNEEVNICLSGGYKGEDVELCNTQLTSIAYTTHWAFQGQGNTGNILTYV